MNSSFTMKSVFPLYWHSLCVLACACTNLAAPVRLMSQTVRQSGKSDRTDVVYCLTRALLL